MFKAAPEPPAKSRCVEESTAKSREIGSALRRARKRSGLFQADICRGLDWGAPKVSRLESGQRDGSTLDIVAYLARAGTAPAEFDRVKRLAELPANGYDLQRHPENMPDLLPTLDFLHSSAKKIKVYEPRRIPSLLQTEQYAEVMLRANRNPKDPLVKDALQARLSRQEVLKGVRSGFDTTFYIDEVALRDPAMRDVLEEQRLQLMMTASIPHCHVHVIPTDSFDEDFQTAFSFFEDYDKNSALTVHTATAMVVLDEVNDMTPYLRKLNELREIALSARESIQRVNRSQPATNRINHDSTNDHHSKR
ncbi:helix-turn-helix transcriptional regulator [Amycolatopsis sp. WAC 04197]|uniref:helix-turn-helix domain-containing protein n=1 Tax=Amycolatopsis sp. WAC 04197 TaxID=2203199 RepID=UPI001315490B|nr:helix-turn-helix transcriptional regulator [Amycolatopsis sp. WAC 04197]